jgi:inorganic triphosphatase YgiF
MGLEREIKLAVPEEFVLPSLDGLGEDVRAVDTGEHALDATYWDTESLQLYHSQCGLRHRTRDGGGGVWTLKGPSRRHGAAVLREETELAGTPDAVPGSLLERVAPILGDALLRPVARVHTDRRTIDLEERGERRVEVADDRVRVLDVDGNESTHFREVELEVLGDAEPRCLAVVVGRIEERGGRPASTAKYARALAALGLIDEAGPGSG